MSANSDSQIDMNNNGGRVLAVDQSSALQVETLGTSLAIGGLKEQIKPGDQCEETADTQQVDSDDDRDEDEQEDKNSSSDSDESFTIEVGARPKFLHSPATRVAELTDTMKGGVQQSHIPVWRFEGRQASISGAKCDDTKPVDDADKSPALAASVGYHTTIRPCVEGEQQAAEILNLFGDRTRISERIQICMKNGRSYRDTTDYICVI